MNRGPSSRWIALPTPLLRRQLFRLNHAGRPERKISSAVERTRSGWSYRASQTLRTLKRSKALDPLFKSKKDYRIFSSLSEVPDEYFSDDSVIQKFLPEKSGDEYVVREYYFLNDAEFLIADVAEKPVFSGGRTIEATTGPAPVELQELRRKLNLEYGKIDYVLRDGKVIIFDANKTVGTLSEPTHVTRRTIDTLARGILSSFQNQPARN